MEIQTKPKSKSHIGKFIQLLFIALFLVLSCKMLRGRGGGLVVSTLAFYSDDLSSNLSDY